MTEPAVLLAAVAGVLVFLLYQRSDLGLYTVFIEPLFWRRGDAPSGAPGDV